jgi:peroxiredoxin
MRLKPIIFFGVVVLLAALAIYQETQAPGPTLVGSEAPDFSLRNFQGETIHLSDYRGKLVFLNFWATWCEPCIREIPDMMRVKDALEGRDFEMLAISVDTSWDDVNAYLDENGFELPTVLDPGQAVKLEYRVTGFPETFLVSVDNDGTGTVMAKYIGERPWAEPRWFDEIERFLSSVEQAAPGGSTRPQAGD